SLSDSTPRRSVTALAVARNRIDQGRDRLRTRPPTENSTDFGWFCGTTCTDNTKDSLRGSSSRRGESESPIAGFPLVDLAPQSWRAGFCRRFVVRPAD